MEDIIYYKSLFGLFRIFQVHVSYSIYLILLKKHIFALHVTEINMSTTKSCDGDTSPTRRPR